jgi:hypothetical protein
MKHAAALLLLLAVPCLAANRGDSPADEAAEATRKWRIGLSDSVQGWAIYQDPAAKAICILSPSGSSRQIKLISVAGPDRQFLKKAPLPTKDEWEASYSGQMADLSAQVTSMEQKVSAIYATLANAENAPAGGGNVSVTTDHGERLTISSPVHVRQTGALQSEYSRLQRQLDNLRAKKKALSIFGKTL